MHTVIAIVILALFQSCHSFTSPAAEFRSNYGNLLLVSTPNASGIMLSVEGVEGSESIAVAFGATEYAHFNRDGLSLLQDTSLFAGRISDDTSISLEITGDTVVDISYTGLAMEASTFISTDNLRDVSGNLTVNADGTIFLERGGVPIASIGQDIFGLNAIIMDPLAVLHANLIIPSSGDAVSITSVDMFGNLDMGWYVISNAILGGEDVFQTTFDDSSVSSLSIDLKHGSTAKFRFNATGIATYDLPPLPDWTADTIVVRGAPQVLYNKGVSFTTTGGTPSILDFYEKTSEMLTLGLAIPRTNITVNITRLGNVVTIALPTVQVTCNATLTIGTFDPFPALPARFSPPVDYTYPILVLNGGPAEGRITILATGHLQMYSDENGSAFRKPNVVGLLATTLTYTV